MGVPSFFRWLLEKYPRVIKYVTEESVQYDDDGGRILPDASAKNPNGVEFDNLYLDMNGIIHPCCHPENEAQPQSEDEMIANIFKYIEHIFSMVRPRKLLYLAIDGVAPRAKMNQQRARRFRAAQERLEMMSTRKKLESYYHKKGWNVPSSPPPTWDHNVITPGTPFMDKLAQALRYWVATKLHSDAGWKGIKVIFSDANVPGEGEHKIAAFIRRIRGAHGYEPNTSHVLYGLDADLFMLGLATHEPHFYVLREEVLFGKNRPCDKCGIAGHFADRCNNEPKEATNSGAESKSKSLKPFVFADLSVLREYLEYELYVEELEWWDLERVIDDFVFLCFFVGNDFLPHLPSLEIREGALDELITFYKQNLPKFGGYLTESGGRVNLQRANALLKQLGDREDEVFKNRTQSEQDRHRRNQNRENMKRKQKIYERRSKQPEKQQQDNNNNEEQVGNYYGNERSERYKKQNEVNAIKLEECKLGDEYDEDQVEFLEFFNEYELSIDDHFMEKDFEHKLKAIHRASQDVSKCKNVKKEEDLMFGTEGFKQRYYKKKMSIVYQQNPPLLQKLCFEYVRGLCWVMLYYYQGCVSWSWYYPFHYAPFASDLKQIHLFEEKFEFDKIKSKPFSPFGQLMGVLPAASGKIALPPQFSRLMYEPDSPIIDFYPTDFKLDLNGKMYNWQAVILLPFVDADRLLTTIAPLEAELTGDLKRMNGVGKTLLFVNKSHVLARSMLALYPEQRRSLAVKQQAKNGDGENKDEMVRTCSVDVQLSQGITGELENNKDGVLCGEPLIAPKKVKVLATIESGVNVVSCTYKLPPYTPHKCEVLAGVRLKEAVLDATDFEHMEKAPRFGKPRKFRRRDTHFNYNRGWDQNIGYAEGIYKAKHNKHMQYELHYQPTRSEYNRAHSNYYQQARNEQILPQWIPKQKAKDSDTNNNTNTTTNNNAYEYDEADTSYSQTQYKSVKNFPVFDPYPSQCDVWSHRPSNAPLSMEPMVDIDSVDVCNQHRSYNNNNRGGNYRGGGGYRQYNSRRNNNNNNKYDNRGGYGGQAGGGGYYNNNAGGYYNQYDQLDQQPAVPSNYQWYPQGSQQAAYNQYNQQAPQPQQSYYAGYANYYQPPQPYYPQQAQNYGGGGARGGGYNQARNNNYNQSYRRV